MGEDASRFEEKIKQFKDNWSKDDPLWIWFRKVDPNDKDDTCTSICLICKTIITKRLSSHLRDMHGYQKKYNAWKVFSDLKKWQEEMIKKEAEKKDKDKKTFPKDIEDLKQSYRITDAFLEILVKNGLTHRSIMADLELSVLQDLAPDLGQRVVITNIWRHLQDDPMEFLPDFQKRRASFSEAAPSKPYSVTSTSDDDDDAADDATQNENSDHPLKPRRLRGQLRITDFKKNSVQLRWEPPEDDPAGDTVDHYEVEVKEVNMDSVEEHGSPHHPGGPSSAANSNSSSPSSSSSAFHNPFSGFGSRKPPPRWRKVARTKNRDANVTGLKKGSWYRFRVRPRNPMGAGEYTTMHPVMVADVPSAPTNVVVFDETVNSVKIAWHPPDDDGGSPIMGYVIQARSPTSSDWIDKIEITDPDITTAKVTDLKERQSFEFRIMARNDRGNSPFATTPKVTLPHFAMEILKYCQADENTGEDPMIFQLPVFQTFENEEGFAKIRVLDVCLPQIKKVDNLAIEEKVILVVGETGAGKTTLINGLANYVCGVNWNDNFRFKLIEENKKTQDNDNVGDQSSSQTRYISAYRFPYSEEINKLNHGLIVVDTPGFGDTEGISRDRELEQQVRCFFEGKTGIDHVDAVCFVIPASNARLTPSQMYVFNAILSMFGKDIGENFMVLFTFADGQRPPAIAAMEKAEIPCRLFCKMNNSALYASNNDDVHNKFIDEMFWNMGMASMMDLFDTLQTMSPKSLTLTQNVLNRRSQLQADVEALQQETRRGLAKLNECKQEWDIVQKNNSMINDNKEFKYKATEIKMRKETYKSGYDTNCLTCSNTCHFPCHIPKDEEKSQCAAMDPEGNCRICVGKCHWSVHHNVGYRIVHDEITVEKEYSEMRDKYQDAISGKMNAEKLMNQIRIEFETIQRTVLSTIDNIRKANNELKEIALRPNPLTSVQHIDLLIESEKQQQRFNWEKRVQNLEVIRRLAQITERAVNDGFDPWEEWKKDPASKTFFDSAVAPTQATPPAVVTNSPTLMRKMVKGVKQLLVKE